jgi:hypothetical protein
VKLAGAHIEFGEGYTLSTYPDGRVVAFPEDNDPYRERAKSLGYGNDTALMSREHEVTHHLLAHWLGLPHSPTMMSIAISNVFKDWRTEEAAVLSIQAFARLMKVDLLEAAKRIAG